MNKRIFISLFTAISLCIGTHSYAVKVLAISGVNGLGSESDYVANLIGVDESDVIQVQAPGILRDLGQNRCMKFLDKKVKELNEPYIIHATSQGGGTALNYLATHCTLASSGNAELKALILEAPLVTGNSTMQHTTSGALMDYTGTRLPKIGKWPFAYYWLPYLSKVIFPNYSPAGIQPIRAIQNIAQDIPIIIIHSHNDLQIPFNDAGALYYALRTSGKQVYFIQMEGLAHVNLVKRIDNRDIMMQIRAVLEKNGILSKGQSVDKIEIQPDHQQFQTHYHELLEKEKNHWLIARFLRLGGGLGLAGLGSWFFIKEIIKLHNGYEGHDI